MKEDDLVRLVPRDTRRLKQLGVVLLGAVAGVAMALAWPPSKAAPIVGLPFAATGPTGELRVGGMVVPGSVIPASAWTHFTLEHDGFMVPVHYEGPAIPPSPAVVVVGVMRHDGIAARTVLAR